MKLARFALVLVAAGLLTGCAQTSARPARIDPRADEALRRMGNALGSAKSFSFRSSATMDELLPTGQLAAFSRETRIRVRRPDHVAAEIRRGDDTWQIWYAGRQFTAFDAKAGVFASMQVPGRIDDTLDFLADKYELAMPLADFLFADPYKVLTADVLAGTFVGTHEVDGTKCAHLLFTQAGIDWQIWIAQGKQPLPRRILIDYKNQPGRPQFEATLSDWDLSATLSDDQFKPVVAPEARKVEFSQMLKKN